MSKLSDIGCNILPVTFALIPVFIICTARRRVVVELGSYRPCISLGPKVFSPNIPVCPSTPKGSIHIIFYVNIALSSSRNFKKLYPGFRYILNYSPWSCTTWYLWFQVWIHLPKGKSCTNPFLNDAKKEIFKRRKTVKKEQCLWGKRIKKVLIPAYSSGYESWFQAVMRHKLNYGKVIS